jgi:hypothetical protein
MRARPSLRRSRTLAAVNPKGVDVDGALDAEIEVGTYVEHAARPAPSSQGNVL